MFNPRLVIRILILSALLIISIGTLAFHELEGWTWLDSFYFSVVTMTTIGYGDHVPLTALGKLFTTIYAVVSVFVFLALAATFSSFVSRVGHMK